jgi:PhnB protein
MKLDVYVNYPGNCEQAFQFYEKELNGRIVMTQRHTAQPNLPADWPGKIMHAQIEIGGSIVMGADIPGAEPMRSAYLTLQIVTPEETDRIYAALSAGGEIFMKIHETFFAHRFAMLRDRFGASWMLMCSKT